MCTTRTDDWCIKGGMHVTVTADSSYNSSIQLETTLQYKFLSHATEGALDRHAHRWVDRNNTPIDGMGVRQSYNLGCSYVTVNLPGEVPRRSYGGGNRSLLLRAACLGEPG